jgi:hypothetical protein
MENNQNQPVNADAEVKIIEAKTKTAKEQASKRIGLWGLPTLIILVGMAIASSIMLDTAALPAVIGLTSSVSMALITLLQGITGVKDDAAKPEKTKIGVSDEGVKISSADTEIETKPTNKE